jgi:hypothetical protein
MFYSTIFLCTSQYSLTKKMVEIYVFDFRNNYIKNTPSPPLAQIN